MFKVSAEVLDRFNQKRNQIMAERKLDDWDQRPTERQKRGRVERMRHQALQNQATALLLSYGIKPAKASISQSALATPARSMEVRLQNVAKGSQPAVVKLTSFGSGARLGSMYNYVSRDGEIELEDENGVKHQSKEAFGDIREDWQDLISNRKESRDIGVFSIEVEGQGVLTNKRAQDVINSAFGDRNYAYSITENEDGNSAKISGLVVLRSEQGERLTADNKAQEIVQSRFDESHAAKTLEAKISFHGHGNGIEYGRSRSQELFSDKVFHDNNGKERSLDEFNKNLTKEWNSSLESRKVRDVMHVIVSAKAGTNPANFEKAARGFLGDTFGDHKYVFAVHDPKNDPKEANEGGKRPHIHAHAIITMRSKTGERVAPTISTFKEWRENMAHHGRENGIAMEMTDRREMASAPAFKQKDVKANYSSIEGDKTNHTANTEASARRVRNKRINAVSSVKTPSSQRYQLQAKQVWQELKLASNDTNVLQYAENISQRLNLSEELSNNTASSVIDASEKFNKKDKLVTDLNVEDIPEFTANANLAIEAIQNNDALDDAVKKETIDNLNDLVETTSELAEAREIVRSNLNEEELENYDSLTEQRNKLLDQALADGKDPAQVEAIAAIDEQIGVHEDNVIDRINLEIQDLSDDKNDETAIVNRTPELSSLENDGADEVDLNEDIRQLQDLEDLADKQDKLIEQNKQLELAKLRQKEQDKISERDSSIDLDLSR